MKANITGVLTFKKSYKTALIESKDKDFIDLAKLDGKRVKAFIPEIQPAVSKNDMIVTVMEPIPMTMPYSILKDIEKIDDAE